MKRKSPKELEPETEPSQVLWVMCSGIKCIYDFRIDAKNVTLLRLSAELTQKLGLKGSKLIAAKKTGCLEHGMMVLYEDNGRYDIGRVIYDHLTDLFAIAIGDYDIIFPSDVKVLGEPVGWCDDGKSGRILRFRKI